MTPIADFPVSSIVAEAKDRACRQLGCLALSWRSTLELRRWIGLMENSRSAIGPFFKICTDCRTYKGEESTDSLAYDGRKFT